MRIYQFIDLQLWQFASLIKKSRVFLVHSNKFGFSHQQTLSFSGSLILRISFTWKTQGLLIREAKFLFRSPKKLKIFLFEMQTAIIAHQWKSKFSQCTANPAGLQRKTDRKMEKPIALRTRSFFPWAKLLVLNFVERKNHSRCPQCREHPWNATNFVIIIPHWKIQEIAYPMIDPQ